MEEGKPAPDFELKSDSGETVKLSDLRGKQVVLYFYPKDDTPGCTTQACGIRDAYGEFEREGAVVLGVSPDDERSHVKFKQKYELPFALLADVDHSVSEDYGVWVEKSYAGKKYMGIDALDVRDRRGRHGQACDAPGEAGLARRRRSGNAAELARFRPARRSSRRATTRSRRPASRAASVRGRRTVRALRRCRRRRPARP